MTITAIGQSQRLLHLLCPGVVLKCLPGIISAPSKVVKCAKGSKPDLGHWHYGYDQRGCDGNKLYYACIHIHIRLIINK